MKRILLPVLTALSLTACTETGPFIRIEYTPEQLAGVDQPLLLATLPQVRSQATAVIAGRNGEVTTWTTGDRTTLAFDDGVLVATRGLGHDLMNADATATLGRLRAGQGGDWAPRLHTYLDGEGQTVFAAYQCRMDVTGRETVEIAGTRRATLAFRETCRGPDTEFANLYWRGDGITWRSRQWVSAEIGHVETERLVR